MDKPHVLQMGPYEDWDLPALEARFVLHRLYEAADKATFLAEVGPKVRAIATRGDVGAPAAVISACPNLEMIAINGVGYDAVDFPSVRARGIKVSNTPGVLDGDCADLAVGMMLALGRSMVSADAWARSGNWARNGDFPVQRRVWGARAGILGLGRIGTEVVRRLTGFGMKISYLARSPRDVPWDFVADPVELARQSDFLFVTALANASTRHIVNADVLRALGPKGMLINISRAQNIDEAALLDALEAGTIGGAALDVFVGEPAINPRFAALGNVLLQPHIGSATEQTRRAMGKLMLDNMVAHFEGRPLLTEVI